MKYERLSCLDDERFLRQTGVKRVTFDTMLTILQKAHTQKKLNGGRPNGVEVVDMLLMTLEYLREYRTYFHIGNSYGMCESSAYRTIKWVEDILIKDGTFSLPGKKALLKHDTAIDVILMDATESPIQRPKKNRKDTIQARKKDIH